MAGSGTDDSRSLYIRKEIECSSENCGFWTVMTIKKNTMLKNKRHLCGFCAAERDNTKQKLLEQQTNEINKLKNLINEKIDDLKTHFTAKFDELKLDLEPQAPSNNSPHSNFQPNTSERKFNLIIIGIDEEVGQDPLHRSKKLEEKICNIARELNFEEPKTVIADYYRIGKFNDGKRRPVLLKFGNIWGKRKALAEFYRIKSERRLNYFIREDRPMSEKHKKAKIVAQQRNEEEKAKSNGQVTVSYSGRSDGSVIKYVLSNGRWKKEDLVARNE